MEKKSFLQFKSVQEKEPIGNIKKRYVVGCYNQEDWQYIHKHLLLDGTLEDNIPTEKCECVDEKNHSPTRGVYLLTEEEVFLLRNDPRVKYVHIDCAFYKGTYLLDPKSIKDYDRYEKEVKNYRGSFDWMFNEISNLTPTEEDSNRTSHHLHRTSQKNDPWKGLSTTSFSNNDYYINSILYNKLITTVRTGVDIDVIVGDTRCWFGHIEFHNGLQENRPRSYTGGNVLKSGFSNLSTTGTCDLLDLILDSPYYLDPEYFESDPTNLLTKRWDGTTVPTDQAARDWWGSELNRSSESILGGSTVNIISSYNRNNCNGSHILNPATDTNAEFHGTACASQAYGRTHGWAFNSNKWYVNVYGTDGCGIEEYFDIMKLFHQYKPNRSYDNTKNPTISSNSWGVRKSLPSNGYYYYRSGTNGSGGIEFSNLNPTGGGSPEFLSNFEQSEIRVEFTDSSLLTSGEELIDSGVIFVCSAGNSNQKLVNSNHSDFNNYWHENSNTPLSSATSSLGGYPTLNTINRQGFPGQIGKSVDENNNVVYKTIPIGCIDSNYFGDTLIERKVSYSNSGDIIPVYCPGENTISASSIDGNVYQLFDLYTKTYAVNYDFSIESWEYIFGGTSSSCPIATGLFATILETNRSWSYKDLLLWIQNQVGDLDEENFYRGTESDTINGGWEDHFSLQGGFSRVLWDAEPIVKETLGEFSSPEGDLEKYFINEYWLIDQYIGDTLWSWGDNYFYQLGVNDNNLGRLDPVETLYQGKNWKQVSCGYLNTIALKIDGTLWGWGNNTYGQLGLNDDTDRTYPVQIGIKNDWKVISSGGYHTACINSSGELYAWGYNLKGQLGINDLNTRTEPILVGNDKDWRFVSTNGFNTMAIKSNGTLWSWGDNRSGQLGIGNTTDKYVPTQVGFDDDWKYVSCGAEHTIAIKNDGSLWGWGLNKDPLNPLINGLIGLGPNVNNKILTPTRIGFEYDWKYINCGSYHSGAIKTNGSLWMWGSNTKGQLGTNDQLYKNYPTEIYGPNLYEWKQVSCGGLHTVGLKLDGTILFWGDTEYYQSSITPQNNIGQPILIPTNINNFKNNWKQVSAGFYHSSAVTSGSNPLLYIS